MGDTKQCCCVAMLMHVLLQLPSISLSNLHNLDNATHSTRSIVGTCTYVTLLTNACPEMLSTAQLCMYGLFSLCYAAAYTEYIVQPRHCDANNRPYLN